MQPNNTIIRQEILNNHSIGKKLNLILVLISVVLYSGRLSGQSQTFNSSGTFNVPSGVTKVIVECWGGGGAGGGATGKYASGGGGAGGTYVLKEVTVTPGNSYTVTVGGQATGVKNSVVNGNPSWFSSVSTVFAPGGKGGAVAASSYSGSAGGVGANGTPIGDIVFIGGSGAYGVSYSYSGGGGGGAGDNSAGGNANGRIGGTGGTSNGGNGATGRTNSGAGATGTVAGGGGSGAVANTNTDQRGGHGAAGRVIVNYPVLTVNPVSLSFGYLHVNTTSVNKTYVLTGVNLAPANGNIQLTAPTGFQVSLNAASGFASSINVPYTGRQLNSTIYVRFQPTLDNTSYSGNITNTGGGAAAKNVAVTGSTKLEYCTPVYTTGTGTQDYIANVQLGNINNTTGASSSPYYTFYSSLSTSLTTNSQHTLFVKAGPRPTGNNISVWIDYNVDGTFQTEEKLGNVTLTANATGSITFTVPSDAFTGPTRMRVREVYNNINIDPCNSYANGEAEDYVINILDPLNFSYTATETCIGATSGTGSITITALEGIPPFQYRLDNGTYQSNNVFTGLLNGTYVVTVKDINNNTGTANVVISSPSPSGDDEDLAGSDTWIGHMYDGKNFETYYGSFTEPETFDEGFGGDYNCFPMTSGGELRSIYAETFSVKFRMLSTRKGLYAVDLGSDDGSRLSVDDEIIYDNWSDQSFSTKANALINLTGNSNLLYEFSENGVNNRVIFNNLRKLIENTLTANTIQDNCGGNTFSAISGDVFGSLPSGITLQGSGYQWTYSTELDGVRTSIAGATSATLTPNTSITPFNSPGTYYIFRNAILKSTTNVSPNPLILTNESNAAIITVGLTSTMPALTSDVINETCPESNDGSITITNIPVAVEFQKSESDYIDLGSSYLNNLSKFTLECWVKFDKSQITGERTWGLMGQNDVIELGIFNSTNLQIWTSATAGMDVPIASYFNDDFWHHIAGVGDGSTIKVYIDGVLAGTKSNTVTNYGSSTYKAMLGGNVYDAAGNYYQGMMLKAGFWNKAMTQAEIQTLANQKFKQYTQGEANLIAGYNFFEGTGTALSKVGTATTNGTFYNSPVWTEVFTYNWTKTGAPEFSANTRNISLIGAGVYTLNATFHGFCPKSGTWSVTSNTQNQWTGNISTDWNTAGNWTCRIPDLTIDATIPNGRPRYPVLNTGNTGQCLNLVMQNATTLTITGKTLEIAGSINNSGTNNITATGGTVRMRGTSVQTIPGNIFANNTLLNLTISNSNGVTLSGPLNISGVVLAETGNLTSNGNLTLLSTSAQTALISGAGTGQILGNVTMQRYLPSAFGYKYFSSPFTNATVAQFADDIDLNASFSTFYYYEENQEVTGWEKYVTPSSPLIPGKGYAANFGPNGGVKTVSTTGAVNNGTIGPFTILNNNKTYTKGYHLMGNPYPSPIDWNLTGWNKVNIDNAIYFFDAGTTDQYLGTYSSYVNGQSSNGIANNRIASQQAFFIHVSDTLPGNSYPVTGSISFTNAIRITNLNPAFHKNDETGSFARIKATLEGSPISDYLLVYFDETARNIFHPGMDALKKMNTEEIVPDLYLITEDSVNTSIKAIPPFEEVTTAYKLVVISRKGGNITLKLEHLRNLPMGYGIYLKDLYTGLVQDLTVNPEYTFSMEDYKTIADRFLLMFSTENLIQDAFGENTFTVWSEGKTVFVSLKMREQKTRVAITDLSGRLLLESTLAAEGIWSLGTLHVSGAYIITVYTDKGVKSKKIFLD